MSGPLLPSRPKLYTPAGILALALIALEVCIYYSYFVHTGQVQQAIILSAVIGQIHNLDETAT